MNEMNTALKKIAQHHLERIEKLRSALEEIRDVARVSDGVEFYAMIAERALTEDEEERNDNCNNDSSY